MRKSDPALHQRRREEILAAAERCFVRSGFHASSMQDISAASGVSMGLLYRYFTNKEAIIEAAAARERAGAIGLIESVPEKGDCAASWCSVLLAMADAASEADYLRLTNEIVAEAGRTPKLLAILRDYDAALHAAISGKLAAQQAAGGLPTQFDPTQGASALLLLLEGLTARNMLGDTRPMHESFGRMVAAVLA